MSSLANTFLDEQEARALAGEPAAVRTMGKRDYISVTAFDSFPTELPGSPTVLAGPAWQTVAAESSWTRIDAQALLVKVLPAGELPELKNVVGKPHAEIGYQLLQGGRRAVIVSVIDNLLKGAASQAVQNFNRMYGYSETEGLQ